MLPGSLLAPESCVAPDVRKIALSNVVPHVRRCQHRGMDQHDRDQPAPEHRRPEGVSDATVEALGKLSAAMDHVEDGRGHLFAFHRLMGSAESTMEEAYDHLRAAGHDDLAGKLDRDVLGANPIPGMWSFQMVESFDDGFYTRAKDLHQRALDELVDGQRHVFEAEMKELRRTRGRNGHEARPAAVEDDPEFND